MSLKSNICNSDVRYPKDDVVFELLGSLDELNVSLGFLHRSSFKEDVINVQKNLISLSSIIAGGVITRETVQRWEQELEELKRALAVIQKDLPNITSFVIPGGTIESCNFHTSRVICRRAERDFVRFIRKKNRYDLLFIQEYLNVLSNYLFNLSRQANFLKGFIDPKLE